MYVRYRTLMIFLHDWFITSWCTLHNFSLRHIYTYIYIYIYIWYLMRLILEVWRHLFRQVISSHDIDYSARYTDIFHLTVEIISITTSVEKWWKFMYIYKYIICFRNKIQHLKGQSRSQAWSLYVSPSLVDSTESIHALGHCFFKSL